MNARNAICCNRNSVQRLTMNNASILYFALRMFEHHVCLLGSAATKGAAEGTGAAAGRLPAVAASATSEGAATGAGSAQGTSASAAANRESGAGSTIQKESCTLSPPDVHSCEWTWGTEDWLPRLAYSNI